MRGLPIFLFGLLVACAAPAAAHSPKSTEDMPQEKKTCVAPGHWLDPAGGAPPDHRALIADMAGRPVVLLGEQHTNAEHHRWQLHVVAALYARNPDMVLGFEAFPRRLQAVLDRWTDGALGEKEFLEQSEWYRVWRYDADLYMPLFHFARMHGIPMIALNVDHALIRKIHHEGVEAVGEDEREGVSEPLPAGEAYLDRLAVVFAHHAARKEGEAEAPEPPARIDPDFRRFVAAQLTWDRAMAEALAATGRFAVGIIGSGHLEYGYGVQRQLADLGIEGSAVLLPWDAGRPCDDLKAGDGAPVAAAVFGVAALSQPEKPPTPLLGVVIEDGEGGVRVGKVMDDSVAGKTDIREGDLIVEAAGVATARTQDLITVVRRQAWGTWLPIRIRRGDETLDLVAKFPISP